MSSSLTGTPFQGTYSLFGVTNDSELCNHMTNIGLLYTVIVGVYSVIKPSPYGRYSQKSMGPTINAKIGWMIQESMSFVVPVLVIFATPGLQLRNFSNITTITLFLVHYFQRSFIYPLTMSKECKPTPIATVIAATIFTTYNGLLQGHHLVNVHKVTDSIYLFTGTVLFLTGLAINISHDQMLISLRKNSKPSESPGKKQYKIPRGGLFEYISGANYFGEILEWTGLAIATGQYPQIVFATFSAVFLGLRAFHHHRFYLETFGSSYPKTRKALIPFLI